MSPTEDKVGRTSILDVGAGDAKVAVAVGLVPIKRIKIKCT